MAGNVYLTRRATFSSSHRLWSPYLTDEENMTLYAKCANPNGHGHNYVLEVTLAGVPDERTGMVMNLTDMKRIINEQIVEWVDHKHLNFDVPWLEGLIPTAEMLVIKFWERLLSSFPPGLLYEVKLYETENNYVVYRGEECFVRKRGPESVMRIALIAPLVTPIVEPFIGGAQAMVADLALGMTQRGHEVTLFAREGSVLPGVTIEEIAVPSSVVPAQFSGSDQSRGPDAGFFVQSAIFLDLFLQLQQEAASFDLVHAHAFDLPSFVYSAFVRDIPVVHTIHLPAIMPEINECLRILHHRGHPLHLVTVSHLCAKTYEEFTPFDRVIYNGVDLSAIPFVASVPDDAPLLFAGRITPEKGVLEAIEIAQRAERPLFIAGGVYDQSFYSEQVVPRLQQAPHVTYLGPLDHEALWSLMGKVTGVLFPVAWDEPFGLVPVEAMAAGTPVIAFARGAVTEIIQHGETGFLVSPGDCVEAASLVPQLAHISRKRCHQHVMEQFSRQHMLDAHEQFYGSLQHR